MKNCLKNRKIAPMMLGIMVPFLPFSLDAATAAPESASTTDECSKDLLLSYFPATFVQQTLTKFNVPKENQDAIVNALTEKDKSIVKMVEEKASKMNPNPLKDPQQRQQAVKIFRETLLQVFSDVMKANGINDDKQIQAMLDDVQQQKAKRFAMCMQKQKDQAKNDDDANSDDDSDDDNDNDDNDNDSEDDQDDKDQEKDQSKTTENPSSSTSPEKK